MCIYNMFYLPPKLQISLGNSPSTINVKYNNCFQRLNILQLDECYTFIILCVYKMHHIVFCAQKINGCFYFKHHFEGDYNSYFN